MACFGKACDVRKIFNLRLIVRTENREIRGAPGVQRLHGDDGIAGCCKLVSEEDFVGDHQTHLLISFSRSTFFFSSSFRPFVNR